MDRIINERYKLIEIIGEGGMNNVYKAEDLKLSELVAVKVLRSEYRNDEEIVKKFHEEAEAIQKLNNDNIVKVLDVGNEEDLHYIVMELLTSSTLKDYIAQSDVYFKNEEIIDISCQILNAIKEAHDAGIIHRDIKPQNILMTEDGEFKVSDFGIASVKKTSTIASSKEAIGSVHYASPEQSRGCILDRRTDIYSFGILLYEISTGRVPFEGDTAISIAIKHSKGDVVKPCFINMSLNPSIQKIILKCIAKTPAFRFENVDILLELFEELKKSPDEALTGELAKKLEIPTETIDMSGMKELIDEVDMELEVDERDNIEVKINENPKKKSNPMPVILTVVGGVIVGAIIFMLLFYNKPMEEIKPETQATMPDIKGMTYSEAVTLLETDKVDVEIDSEEFSDEVEKDKIISQIPEEGAILQDGQTIKVIVSKGEETVIVPNFVGLEYEKANILAHNSDLSVEIEKDFSSEEAGTVISQSIEQNEEVKKGSVINMVVSLGEKANAHIMPNLVNKTKDEALAIINGVKLVPGTIDTRESGKVKEGYIISQSIPAGAEVAEGTIVDFVISLGGENIGDEEGNENESESDDAQNTDGQETDYNAENQDSTPSSEPSADTSAKESQEQTGDETEIQPTSQEEESVAKSFFVPFKKDGKQHTLRIVKIVNGEEKELWTKTYSKDETNVKVNISAKGDVVLRFYVDGQLYDEQQVEF